MTDDEITAIRDAHLPSQGEAFDCVAFARAVIAAHQSADALDAARYRRLRRGQHWSVVDGIGDTLRADELDAAIDAAMAKEST